MSHYYCRCRLSLADCPLCYRFYTERTEPQIVTDYLYTRTQAETLSEIDAESSATYSGLAQAIWSVMTTAEKWESVPNAIRYEDRIPAGLTTADALSRARSTYKEPKQ